MPFQSLSFVALALAAVALFRLSPQGLVRDLCFLVINVFFVVSFADSVLASVPLLAFVALGYATIVAAGKGGRSILAALVPGTIVAFIWLKQYSIAGMLPQLAFPYIVVGLSYLLFRILHLQVDIAQGILKRPSCLSYLNYSLSFLTFVAGPIQRYQDFEKQQSRAPEPLASEKLLHSLGRVLQGYLYLSVLSGFFTIEGNEYRLHFYQACERQAWAEAAGMLTVAALLYFVFLYFNFAGYMNIVIGFGGLAGLSIPENFNAPYKATNFADFWMRWHITLSDWLKTYLFNPCLKALAARRPLSLSINHLATISFFVTFLVMGVWHGTSMQFVVYGIALALGVAINKVWQNEMTHRLGRARYKALCSQAWYIHLARALTLAYMAMSLICVWIEPQKLQVANKLMAVVSGATSFLAIIVLIWIVSALSGPLASVIAGWLASARSGVGPFASRPILRERLLWLWAAIKVGVVAALVVALNWTPEVVYKGF